MTTRNASTNPPGIAHAENHEKASMRDAEMEGNIDAAKGAIDMDYCGIDTRAIPTGIGNEVYERKVAVMNQALIDLGMGSFQWKVYALTGFGWFVDNVSPIPSTVSLLPTMAPQLANPFPLPRIKM